MSRLVELKPKAPTSNLQLEGAPDGLQQKLKDYGERVAKFIPAEILAFYTAAVQLILTKEGPQHATFRLWGFAIVGVIAWIITPIYLSIFGTDPRQVRINQVVGSIAFGVWAYAYPAGWFAEAHLHDPVPAGILLLLFTLISGMYQPREK